MKKLFIDTDIIISFTKGHATFLKELIEKQRKNTIELIVNPIVIAEFFTDKNLINNNKRQQAERLFLNFTVLTIGKQVGLIAGELLRDNKTVSIGDAIIASTCLKNNLVLVTGNFKHFERVKDLKFWDFENKKKVT